jgi:hypothetical protein
MTYLAKIFFQFQAILQAQEVTMEEVYPSASASQQATSPDAIDECLKTNISRSIQQVTVGVDVNRRPKIKLNKQEKYYFFSISLF